MKIPNRDWYWFEMNIRNSISFRPPQSGVSGRLSARHIREIPDLAGTFEQIYVRNLSRNNKISRKEIMCYDEP